MGGIQARTADDDFDSIADGVDETAIARWEGDGEEVGFTRFTEGEGVAFRVGGQAAAKVTMKGFVLGEIHSRRLAVKTNAADTAFFAEDGATDFVIAVGAGGGGGLGEAES